MSGRHCIAALSVDDSTVRRRAKHLEEERRVALLDILAENSFRLRGVDGPYALRLGMQENRLAIDIRDLAEERLGLILLSLTPLRRVIRDYLTVCDSYAKALKSAQPSQLEAIDFGRRALHDEGSEALRRRLAGKVELDHETARRLFTLICALRAPG